MKKRENYREAIVDQMESAIELLGPDHSLLREMQVRDGKLQRLYAELDEVGVGMIVATESGDSWALVLPDASHPGCYRFSAFRSIGWLCHQTYQTLDEVVYRAFEAGYRVVAPRDTLEQLSKTAEWLKGCERLEFIEKMNAGKISYTHMLAEFARIEASYAVSTAA